MKTLVTLSTSLVLAATILVGCGDGSSSYKDKMNKNVGAMEEAKQAEELAKKEAAAKKQLAILNAQPADITVRGAIVIANEEKANILDSRITATMTAGKLEDGSVAPMEKDKAPKIMDKVADTFKIPDDKNNKFINLGCTDITEGDKSGLEELKVEFGDAKSSLSLEAKRVFICGDLKIPNKSFILIAQEVVLKEAKITNDESVNNFFGIATETLRLSGTNSITNQVPSTGVTKDTGINISVQKELADQGKLSITTHGYDVAPAKKETDETKKDADETKKDTEEAQK